MESWNVVSSNADINELLEQYGGFHDSCLVDLFYRSGAHVNENNVMFFGPPVGYELWLTFHSQWYKEPLELCFIGVRRCNIVGFQDRYGAEILDCYLAYHTDLITGRDAPLIVWADNADFSPYSEMQDKLISEPGTTFVIAEKLLWRFASKRRDQ